MSQISSDSSLGAVFPGVDATVIQLVLDQAGGDIFTATNMLSDMAPGGADCSTSEPGFAAAVAANQTSRRATTINLDAVPYPDLDLDRSTSVDSDLARETAAALEHETTWALDEAMALAMQEGLDEEIAMALRQQMQSEMAQQEARRRRADWLRAQLNQQDSELSPGRMVSSAASVVKNKAFVAAEFSRRLMAKLRGREGPRIHSSPLLGPGYNSNPYLQHGTPANPHVPRPLESIEAAAERIATSSLGDGLAPISSDSIDRAGSYGARVDRARAANLSARRTSSERLATGSVVAEPEPEPTNEPPLPAHIEAIFNRRGVTT